MKDVVELFVNAKKKKLLKNIEFKELIRQIKFADPNLILDWDEGAGEDWARFIDSKKGIVFMMHSRIGVVFIRKVYEYDKIKKIVTELEVVFVDNYNSKEWYANLAEFEKIPEVYWHACENAVNTNCFSLDELYYATV